MKEFLICFNSVMGWRPFWVTGGAVALLIDIEDRAADLEPGEGSYRDWQRVKTLFALIYNKQQS